MYYVVKLWILHHKNCGGGGVVSRRAIHKHDKKGKKVHPIATFSLILRIANNSLTRLDNYCLELANGS